MKGSWHTIFTDWYKYQRRQQLSEEVESSFDIELRARSKISERVDSGISFRSLKLISNGHTTPKSEASVHDQIRLKLDFGDKTCIKSLDYGTFSHWSAIEGLLADMEKDGIVVEGLWDVAEKMKVCSGDWDARVRPGWDVHMHCQDVQAILHTQQVKNDSDSDTDSDSEVPESEDGQWIEDFLNQYQEEWCLPRWRDKVEQERSISIHMQEPSWKVLALGCVSVVFFIVAVFVYTA